jgi:hypothetical protein
MRELIQCDGDYPSQHPHQAGATPSSKPVTLSYNDKYSTPVEHKIRATYERVQCRYSSSTIVIAFVATTIHR